MQSLSGALSKLYDDAAWFARAHEVKLLVVQTSGELRKPALQTLSGLEFHADNFSPWIVLEHGSTAADDGWVARSLQLCDDWNTRRKAFSKDGVTLPEVSTPAPELPQPGERTPARANLLGWLKGSLAPAAARPSKIGLEIFARTLQSVVSALRAPLEGVVLVLAPTVIEDTEAFWTDLVCLLGAPELDPCRVVVVLDAELCPLPRRLIEPLGSGTQVLLCDCTVDPDQLGRDLEAMLAGGDPGAPRAAGVGALPRGVTPPRRVDDPPEIPVEQRDALLREAGVEPAFLEQGPRLTQLVLGAALAMKQNRGTEAVRLQREARDLGRELGQPGVAVTCQLALASYLSGLGRRDLAIVELEDAEKYAEARGLFRDQSLALLSLGLVQTVGKKLPEAAHAYVRAAHAAEAAGEPMLAIEGFRMAGQLGAQLGAVVQAMACFKEAMRVAQSSEAELVRSSSAAEAARQFAELVRRRRLPSQAGLIADQSEQMERGEYGQGAGAETDEMDMLVLPPGWTLEDEMLEVLSTRTREMDAPVLPGEETEQPPQAPPASPPLRNQLEPGATAQPPEAPPPPRSLGPGSVELDALMFPRDASIARTLRLDAAKVDDGKEG